MAKQARFWVYQCSAGEPVKIKIAKGQTLSHGDFTRTDEGYRFIGRTWSFDGERVILEAVSDGRDCDGRLSTFELSECAADKLRAGYVCPDHPGIAFPVWQRVSAGQRDYAAEAMGY